MASDSYAELSQETKEAIEASVPAEPEPRSKASLLEEAYRNRVKAETTEDDAERKQYLDNEQVCLKAAEEA